MADEPARVVRGRSEMTANISIMSPALAGFKEHMFIQNFTIICIAFHFRILNIKYVLAQTSDIFSERLIDFLSKICICVNIH